MSTQYAAQRMAAGLGAILLGSYFYPQGRRRPAPAIVAPTAQRQSGSRQPATVAAGLAADEARYCTQCGSRARVEAVFRAVCGRPLKRRT